MLWLMCVADVWPQVTLFEIAETRITKQTVILSRWQKMVRTEGIPPSK